MQWYALKMIQDNLSSSTDLSVIKERPTILIAEDDRAIRNNIAQFLENERYQVIETSNGQECVAAYQQTPPHLVLLDAMMPKMNGFECCKQLLKIPGSANIPILMITGLDDETSINWAFESGASDFITKPIRWPVLKQRVRGFLEKYQLYKQLEAVNTQLTQLTCTNDFTQLPNHHVFTKLLQSEWKRMARDSAPVSLIIAEIDFFKAYQDFYDPLQREQCFAHVADIISQCSKRPADLVGRYGEEGFAVLLPRILLAGAVNVAEEIRRSVNALAIPHLHAPNTDHITMSLGVAHVIPNIELMTIELLFKAADLALNQAKVDGRDQVSAYPSLSPS
ncbi:GGDEF domain-containing response regulator [Acaryochloris marina NIES-2412]|uniref:GGDEF domain-containing response regulator n=1 Tax=Acaryochloris marina TaxID=155978 RepID=UPI0040593284